MSIKRIPRGQEKYGFERLSILGLKVQGGKAQIDEDGVWLSVADVDKDDEVRELKKAQSYSITLPQNLIVSRNAVLVSINPKVAACAVNYSIPTLLNKGWEGPIKVNIRMKEDCAVGNLLKLSIISTEV